MRRHGLSILQRLWLAGIILVLSLCALSCGHGPLIDVCVSYPPSGGLVCVDKQGQKYLKIYAETQGYVAFSPEDIKTLLNYCGIKPKTADRMIQYYSKVTEPDPAIEVR